MSRCGSFHESANDRTNTDPAGTDDLIRVIKLYYSKQKPRMMLPGFCFSLSVSFQHTAYRNNLQLLIVFHHLMQ